ncbi:hypothetical protein VDGD_20482 [Verticillium dahliae]|nr:hypothetical protein VDGD_20482 [Verticillium dahliae]
MDEIAKEYDVIVLGTGTSTSRSPRGLAPHHRPGVGFFTYAS